MVIIWSGLGFLVPVVFFLMALVVHVATDGALGQGYYTAHAGPRVMALLLSVVSVWVLGRRLNGVAPTSDFQSWVVGVYRAPHTLFFVRMEYWGPLGLALGFLIAVLDR